MSCRRHLWKVKETFFQDSAYDQIVASGTVLKSVKNMDNLFARAVIVTYRCADCGSEEVRRV